MSHFIKKCKSCGAVITQCRCMSKDKKIEWIYCGDCLTKLGEEKIKELQKLESFNPPSRQS